MEETLNVQPNEPSGKVRFLRDTAAVLMVLSLLVGHFITLIAAALLFSIASNKNIRIAVGILFFSTLVEIGLLLCSTAISATETDIQFTSSAKLLLILIVIGNLLSLYAYDILIKESEFNTKLHKFANLTFISYAFMILTTLGSGILGEAAASTSIVGLPCSVLHVIGLYQLCESDLFSGNYKADAKKLPFSIKHITSAIVVIAIVMLILKLMN